MTTSRIFRQIRKLTDRELKKAGVTIPGTLHKVTKGTRSSSNLSGGTVPTEAPHACRGFFDSYKDDAIDGTVIQAGDRKATIMGNSIPAGIVPALNDFVTFEGDKMQIVGAVDRDPAGATYTCQVR